MRKEGRAAGGGRVKPESRLLESGRVQGAGLQDQHIPEANHDAAPTTLHTGGWAPLKPGHNGAPAALGLGLLAVIRPPLPTECARSGPADMLATDWVTKRVGMRCVGGARH